MRKALHDFQGGVTITGHQGTHLRYVDDIVLIAASMTELRDLANRVKLESERSGLFLNAKNTKVRKVRKVGDPADDNHILVNNEPVENVSNFTYLGAIFTNNYDDTKEMSIELPSRRAQQSL